MGPFVHQFGASYHRWPLANYMRKKLPPITTFNDCVANRGLTRASLKPTRHPEPVEGSPPYLPSIRPFPRDPHQ